jgi:hypothetical protein
MVPASYLDPPEVLQGIKSARQVQIVRGLKISGPENLTQFDKIFPQPLIEQG